jgi:hypothetical protein
MNPLHRNGRASVDLEHEAGADFTGFLPAISTDALNKISGVVRRWRIHLRTGHTFAGLARVINPIVRGWMQYYGAFYRTALRSLLKRINAYLVRCALDSQEVQTVQRLQESQEMLGRYYSSPSPHVRSLAMEPHGLVIRAARAR